MFKAIAPACIALALAAPAFADEVWSSPTGPIIYQEDAFGSAILSFTNVDGSAAELVIPGLAGNFTDRGVHHGYFIGQGPLECDAALARPGGLASLDWGRAVVSFDRPNFPTGFTVTMSDCDYPLSYSIRAEVQ
ncbi:hypothetical protein [Nioella aestuarii]|uniref:hypothetical protein n=1 Tax=Nioella aestuarii TaxID=1662864 RepID=UPI003D7F3B91